MSGFWSSEAAEKIRSIELLYEFIFQHYYLVFFDIS